MEEKENKEKKVMEDEIFNIEKDGKEEVVRKEILEEDKPASPAQLKKEKKIFTALMIIMFSCLVMFAVFYFIVNSSSNFEYKSVKFQAIKMGELLLYDTFIPVSFNNTIADYHFYLRTDPRTIENLVFDGKIRQRKDMVINFTEEFDCDKGIIAIANFLKLQEIIGTKVIRDENATCDDQGRYTFVRILPGNETKITEYGVSGGCYDIQINNCEMLKGTEKFMLETFVEIKKNQNN